MRDTTKVLQRSRLPAEACPRPMGEPKQAAAAAAAGARDEEEEEEEGGEVLASEAEGEAAGEAGALLVGVAAAGVLAGVAAVGGVAAASRSHSLSCWAISYASLELSQSLMLGMGERVTSSCTEGNSACRWGRYGRKGDQHAAARKGTRPAGIEEKIIRVRILFGQGGDPHENSGFKAYSNPDQTLAHHDLLRHPFDEQAEPQVHPPRQDPAHPSPPAGSP